MRLAWDLAREEATIDMGETAVIEYRNFPFSYARGHYPFGRTGAFDKRSPSVEAACTAPSFSCVRSHS